MNIKLLYWFKIYVDRFEYKWYYIKAVWFTKQQTGLWKLNREDVKRKVLQEITNQQNYIEQ